MTASQLFASNPGPHKCYYCGCSCGPEYLTKDYVKDTFTNRDIVRYPGSDHVCSGCVAAMGEGEDEMAMLDGTVKVRQNARGMCPRMYSWLLTATERKAGTKAHARQFRELILDPPEPPFAIVLADSGQKQLLFRAPVALDRDVFPVMLEDEIIEVDRSIFPVYLETATRLCAATGRPSLTGDLGLNTAIACEKWFGSIEPLENWMKIQSHPMASLAAWVCKNREEARDDYPQCSGVSAEVSRTNRPKPAVTGNGTGGDEGRGRQAGFDFA